MKPMRNTFVLPLIVLFAITGRIVTAVEVTDPVCVTANGEKLPKPGSKLTYETMFNGTSISVPVGMVFVPPGEFTFGNGSSAKRLNLDGYCIGKYHVTNAEFKIFLDATRGRAPNYWTDGNYPRDKANHPVAFVSMSQALAYTDWLSRLTGWKFALPTSEQWEKAARGPKNSLYPWGDSLDAQYANGVLISRCNFNAVIAAEYLQHHGQLETSYSAKSQKYGGQKTTVERIMAYDESGRASPFSISPSGQVRGWVAHSTNTGFIGTELFRSISNQGGYTTPVGKYENGKSGYGCYDMAGNLWTWCDTKIVATNGAEKGKTVNEIRGGSWYATGSSCKSVSIGEGRAPFGAYNTVGFRIVMTPSSER